jgi:HSP20 family protein
MNIVKRSGSTADSFFDDFITKEFFDWPSSPSFNWIKKTNHSPKANILESDDAFLIQLAVPGYKKQDFKVSVEDTTLTISSSQIDNEKEEEQVKVTSREFGFGAFERSFMLPETVDTSGIEARYNEGLLEVGLPKLEKARKKPIKTIKVK